MPTQLLSIGGYRSLFENSMDAVLLTIPDGRIIAANPAACSMFGMTEAELCVLGTDRLIDTKDPRFSAFMEQRNLAGKTRGELILRKKDGSTFMGEASSVILEQGHRAFFIIHDMSERKQVEEALCSSEERLRRAVRIDTVGVLFFSLDGRLHDANDAFERMSGYNRRELAAMDDWMALTVPEFVGVTKQTAENLADGGTTPPYEKQMIRKDGSRWWGLFAPTRLSGRGRESQCVEFIIDITQQKQAEAASRESEDRYRSLFEAIDEGFCIVEMLFDEKDKPMDYRFLDVNRAFESQTGISNPVGRCMREIAPAHEEHWFEIYGRVALTGESVRFQNAAEELGRYFDVYAFRIDRPEERHVAILFNDITERRRTEEKVIRLNAELKRANQELEAFNYSVAHDLRTPLAVISGYLELAKQGCEITSECGGYLQSAHEGTLKMEQLIDGLLEFSRVSREEPKRQEIDLGAMAQEVIRDMQVAEPDRRVTLRITEDGMAEGDPRLLRVVLTNLLGNAWKYTRIREVAQIEFGVKNQEGRKIFFVRDNGTGFEMAEAEKLFIPFHRLSGSTEFRGEGIGLATVARIIDRHGGRIWAEGEPGKGATFYFTLHK